MAAPMQPAPTMITSYARWGWAAVWRARERGQAPQPTRLLEPSLIEKCAAHSSMSTCVRNEAGMAGWPSPELRPASAHQPPGPC
jgi:hypothetical protein